MCRCTCWWAAWPRQWAPAPINGYLHLLCPDVAQETGKCMRACARGIAFCSAAIALAVRAYHSELLDFTQYTYMCTRSPKNACSVAYAWHCLPTQGPAGYCVVLHAENMGNTSPSRCNRMCLTGQCLTGHPWVHTEDCALSKPLGLWDAGNHSNSAEGQFVMHAKQPQTPLAS
jgi:hypothetical protein